MPSTLSKRYSSTGVFLWILRYFKKQLFRKFYRKTHVAESLWQSTCNFVEKETPAQLFSYEFGGCFLSIAIICQEHKTKCEKNESNDIPINYLYILMASIYMWMTYITSIHQTASVCKNTAKPYQFISSTKRRS